MKKNLFLRTDVLPEEISILFSNKNVYNKFTKYQTKKLGSSVSNESSIPLFFDVPKGRQDTRKIGLLHPIAQIKTFDYILKYDQLIASFSKKSLFSVRSPIRVNRAKLTFSDKQQKEISKIEEEFSFSENSITTSDEDQLLFFNYFSYSKYKKITDLYKSPKFNRAKYKYKHFLKLDIQRCFPSIYTHSLAWALFGDKSLAKKYRNEREMFPNATDKIAQDINFSETHGLVVGPEFSRVIAELLLTQVDVQLVDTLENENLKINSDYVIYRFVDDYFIFSNDEDTIQNIQLRLRELLSVYHLTLNTNKSELQVRPFQLYDSSILELKKIVKEFEMEKFIAASKKNINVNNYLGTRFHWDDLFIKVESLVARYPDSSSRVVNYFLKTIRSSIEFEESINLKFIYASIMEVVTNVFSLNISHKSTQYLIAIFAKMFNKMEIVKKHQIKSMSDSNSYRHNDIIKDRIEENKRKLDSVNFLEEKMFQNLFRLLKNNKNGTKNMYDILAFMRVLNKKLPASFLSGILESNSNSYFVCCSVAYYILDSDLSSLDGRYKTVIKKIEKIVESRIYLEKEKGATHKLFDSEYFYFLNDFSKYPGFEISIKSRLENQLLQDIRSYASGNPKRLEICEAITRSSYYDWGMKSETFIRKIAKKSSNLPTIMGKIDYL